MRITRRKAIELPADLLTIAIWSKIRPNNEFVVTVDLHILKVNLKLWWLDDDPLRCSDHWIALLDPTNPQLEKPSCPLTPQNHLSSQTKPDKIQLIDQLPTKTSKSKSQAQNPKTSLLLLFKFLPIFNLHNFHYSSFHCHSSDEDCLNYIQCTSKVEGGTSDSAPRSYAEGSL